MRHVPAYMWFTVLALASALVGVIAFLALTGPAAFLQAQTDILHKDQSALVSIRKIVDNANAITYGTVVAVDAGAQTIDISTKDPFESGPDVTLRLHVIAPAYIAQQVLQGQNSVADSLSRTVISSLSQIHAGDHAAFTYSIESDKTLTTHYLIFGDPL